jgi:PPM family protein phosphatase
VSSSEQGESGGQSLVIDHGATTDVGLKRKANEDSFLVGYPLFAVADGMGGHDAGDRASQAVVGELRALVGAVGVGPEELAVVLERAQSAVGHIADETERGAGSTLTGVVVTVLDERAHWLVFNIGDSRVYRVRDGELAQLTVDHSVAQQLIDEGTLDRADLADFQGKNVITRAVGADDSDADYWMHPIVQNERLMLCSDGLSGEVTDEQILAIMLATPGAQAASDALVAEALANGGRDNVTVVVLDVVAGGLDPDVDDATRDRSIGTPEPADFDGTTVELPMRRGSRGAN